MPSNRYESPTVRLFGNVLTEIRKLCASEGHNGISLEMELSWSPTQSKNDPRAVTVHPTYLHLRVPDKPEQEKLCKSHYWYETYGASTICEGAGLSFFPLRSMVSEREVYNLSTILMTTTLENVYKTSAKAVTKLEKNSNKKTRTSRNPPGRSKVYQKDALVKSPSKSKPPAKRDNLTKTILKTPIRTTPARFSTRLEERRKRDARKLRRVEMLKNKTPGGGLRYGVFRLA